MQSWDVRDIRKEAEKSVVFEVFPFGPRAAVRVHLSLDCLIASLPHCLIECPRLEHVFGSPRFRTLVSIDAICLHVCKRSHDVI